jgi:hypothetical protein
MEEHDAISDYDKTKNIYLMRGDLCAVEEYNPFDDLQSCYDYNHGALSEVIIPLFLLKIQNIKQNTTNSKQMIKNAKITN